MLSREIVRGKMMGMLQIAIAILCAASVLGAAEHGFVYKEPGKFGGWPANHGMWSWGDEMLVGFEVGHFRDTEKGHAIDYTKPAEHVLARSTDGGKTWKIERPEGLKPPPGVKVAGVPTGPDGRPLMDSPGGFDFTQPGFVLTARMESHQGGQSRFYVSRDKGRSWQGPFRLPDFGQAHGTAARTDYLVNSKHDLTMFITVAKSNGREGRVMAVRTRDGAKTWTMESFVTPEPEGNDYAIMPSSIRLKNGSIITAVRYRKYIEIYRSDDDAKTWRSLGQAVDTLSGNPPSMIQLKDGRIALTYGHRAKPYGIRAKLSKDEGKTWGEEIVLRDDGGNWDLGYPRTVQRTDGKLVTVYYYNTAANAERFIGYTIWEAK